MYLYHVVCVDFYRLGAQDVNVPTCVTIKLILISSTRVFCIDLVDEVPEGARGSGRPVVLSAAGDSGDSVCEGDG